MRVFVGLTLTHNGATKLHMLGNGATAFETNNNKKYQSFISYSRSDAAFANRLHHDLETYKIPKSARLSGGISRLSPIFLDRSDLAAGGSLSRHIEEALANSQALIVVASPAAKASKWVAKEIEIFRSLHPRRPILVALVQGTSESAFPTALKAPGYEPIAADFREGGDGRRLALLKLVAGLACIPLDSLIQRDAKRKLRRVMWVTVFAFSLVLLATSLMIMAVRAQHQAERQREKAESLVEYNLKDLRENLYGTGQLSIMDEVNRRTLAYFQEQDQSELTDTEKDLRTRILQYFVQDEEDKGNLRKALDIAEFSLRESKRNFDYDKKNARHIYVLAQSNYAVGHVNFLQRRYSAAGAYWEEYARLAQVLVAIDPGSEKWWLEEAASKILLCRLSVVDRSYKIGERFCDVKVTSYEEDIYNRHPGDAHNFSYLSEDFVWIGLHYIQSGRYDKAYEVLMKASVLADRVYSDHDVVSLRAKWHSEQSMSEYFFAIGNRSRAIGHARIALENINKMIAIEPRNIQWKKYKKETDSLLSEM
ncbi:toll/interleukin-1 receptor domain-containing protein [Sphingomonas sp. 3P27F8]|uniref:toll/interleukin-1 receptor domain-containing protein n=1 Tax=Sphingomonas sp. 3P27F8 TaxID=2502213 RepID=UPI0010F7F572|nr:toll/interleukin-1 receptor domain-containing protein [Sphingomonas sp. 3P27F8]